MMSTIQRVVVALGALVAFGDRRCRPLEDRVEPGDPGRGDRGFGHATRASRACHVTLGLRFKGTPAPDDAGGGSRRRSRS